MTNNSEFCLEIFSHRDGVKANLSGEMVTMETAKLILNTVITPGLCVFGILGNLLNVFVLTRKKFQCLDCSHERVAVIGLIMLALSDMLYCVSALPMVRITRRRSVSFNLDFMFLYQIHGDGIRAYFTYTSNWLTVLTAVSRYLAICRPLQYRGLVTNRSTGVAVTGIFVFWAVLILPVFWTFDLKTVDCSEHGFSVYLRTVGYFIQHRQLKLTFSYLWSILGSFTPILLLAYCNYHLIRAVRESTRLRERYRVHSRARSPGGSITVTLVAIICMFIVCTTPREILKMFFYSISSNNVEQFITTIVAAEVMLTLNYSINFLLYCVVNSHFRKTVKNILCCGVFGKVTRKFSFGSKPHQTQVTFNISKSNVNDISKYTHNKILYDPSAPDSTDINLQDKIPNDPLAQSNGVPLLDKIKHDP